MSITSKYKEGGLFAILPKNRHIIRRCTYTLATYLAHFCGWVFEHDRAVLNSIIAVSLASGVGMGKKIHGNLERQNASLVAASARQVDNDFNRDLLGFKNAAAANHLVFEEGVTQYSDGSTRPSYAATGVRQDIANMQRTYDNTQIEVVDDRSMLAITEDFSASKSEAVSVSRVVFTPDKSQMLSDALGRRPAYWPLVDFSKVVGGGLGVAAGAFLGSLGTAFLLSVGSQRMIRYQMLKESSRPPSPTILPRSIPPIQQVHRDMLRALEYVKTAGEGIPPHEFFVADDHREGQQRRSWVLAQKDGKIAFYWQ